MTAAKECIKRKTMPRLHQSRFAVPFYIFTFYLGFYLVSAQGILSVADSRVNFQMVWALVETNSLTIDCEIREDFIEVSPSGKCYSKYDLGLAVTSIPFYLLGRALYGPAPPGADIISKAQIVVGMFTQFVTAATCAVLYLLASNLLDSHKKAFDLVMLFGICTIAWPYSSQFLSQPFVALLLLVAVFILIKGKGNPTQSGYAIAGLALGWACFTRLDTVPLALITSGYAFFQLRQKSWPWYAVCRFMAFLLLPVLLAIIAYLVYQFIRSGQWLQIGYEGEGWDTPFALGLYGLLFSPGKGLSFYSPLAILAFVGLRQLWQRGRQAEVALIGTLFIVQLAIYASWWAWDGGWTWGPRFLVSTQPLLILGLSPWLNRPKQSWLLLALATLGYFIQMIGVATDPINYLGMTHFSYEQTLFTPVASPIWGQLQDLRQLRVVLFVANQGHGLFTKIEMIIFILASVLLMVFGGIQAVRTVRREADKAHEPSGG